MEKKTGNDLLKNSKSSIIIAQQDARSLSKPDKSVDIILDKVKLANRCYKLFICLFIIKT